MEISAPIWECPCRVNQKIPEVVFWWQAPQVNYLKRNFDASKLLLDDNVGVAAVARNSEGQIKFGLIRRMKSKSILVGGREAVRLAMCFVESHNIQKVVFKSDSKQVIEAINGEGLIPLEIPPIVDEIIRMKSNFPDCSFSWIPRSANMVANWLAIIIVILWNVPWIGRSIPAPRVQQDRDKCPVC